MLRKHLGSCGRNSYLDILFWVIQRRSAAHARGDRVNVKRWNCLIAQISRELEV